MKKTLTSNSGKFAIIFIISILLFGGIVYLFQNYFFLQQRYEYVSDCSMQQTNEKYGLDVPESISSYCTSIKSTIPFHQGESYLFGRNEYNETFYWFELEITKVEKRFIVASFFDDQAYLLESYSDGQEEIRILRETYGEEYDKGATGLRIESINKETDTKYRGYFWSKKYVDDDLLLDQAFQIISTLANQ